jgi:hypothetical protein
MGALELKPRTDGGGNGGGANKSRRGPNSVDFDDRSLPRVRRLASDAPLALANIEEHSEGGNHDEGV